MSLELRDVQSWAFGSPEEVLLLDADAHVVWANEAAQVALGYDLEALQRLSLRDFAPASAPGFPERLARAQRGELETFRTVHLRRDGSAVTKEARAFYAELDGRPHLCAYLHEVSERGRAEAALRQVTRLYTVLSRVNAAVVRAQSDAELFEAVCRAATEPGCFRMAWVGLERRGEVVPAASAGHVAGYLDGVAIGLGEGDPTSLGPTGVAVRLGRLDICGDIATERRMAPWRQRALTRGYLSSAAVPLRRRERVVGALMLYGPEPEFFAAREQELLEQLSRDISFGLTMLVTRQEHALLQKQLERAQRLEALGRLAGGVGHDFNNMLGVILSSAEMALQATPVDSPVREDLEQIRDAAERSARLTRQLLQVARQQPSEPRALQLDEELQRALPLLKRLAGDGVEVKLVADAKVRVRLDPVHLDQLLTNLVTNARQAMAGRGHVTVRCGRTEVREAGAVPAGAYGYLSVQDDGPGMAPEVLDRAFEPFFTTKAPGEGTGLGLATVYSQVRQAGGTLEACSAPGEGATFSALLPLAA